MAPPGAASSEPARTPGHHWSRRGPPRSRWSWVVVPPKGACRGPRSSALPSHSPGARSTRPAGRAPEPPRGRAGSSPRAPVITGLSGVDLLEQTVQGPGLAQPPSHIAPVDGLVPLLSRPQSASVLPSGLTQTIEHAPAMGLEAPSPAWPARIYRSGGGGAGPSRPRDRGRRGAGSTRPAPNARRRLDATEYVLAGGRKGGDLAGSRTTTGAWRWPGWSPRAMAGQAAIDVFDKGVAARGAHPAPARPTTARPSTPAGAESPAAWWSTCAPWASNPPPADPTGPPPRARTSASTRPCSATWTSSPWPPPSPNFRIR